MKKSKFILAFLAVSLFFVACKPEPTDPDTNSVSYGAGLYIVNEGNFGQGNGDITYYEPATEKVSQDIFSTANSRPLGDVPNSMLFYEGKAYVVVNNSQPPKIEVVNANTFKAESIITGFTSPREILLINASYAYVSDMQVSAIHTIDLQKMAYKNVIQTGKAVENMYLYNQKVFLLNWSNAYVQAENTTTQVIDPSTDQITQTISLRKEPQSMTVDRDGKIWILCAGGWNAQTDTFPALYRLDAQSYTVEKTLPFPAKGSAPSSLRMNMAKDTLLYILGGKVYKCAINADSLPINPFISSDSWALSNMVIDPQCGDIYLADPKDYSQKGCVYRYDAQGNLRKTIPAGVSPRAMIFK